MTDKGRASDYYNNYSALLRYKGMREYVRAVA